MSIQLVPVDTHGMMSVNLVHVDTTGTCMSIHLIHFDTSGPTGIMENYNARACKIKNRFLAFGKQTYTREAAAVVFEIVRSLTLQENTWTARNKDSTQIYT